MSTPSFPPIHPNSASPITLSCHFPLNILAAQGRKGLRIRCDYVPTQQGNSVEGIMTFLNPVDAHMEAAAESSDENWQVLPFESIDPTHFINTHHSVLRLLVVYGVAATRDSLLPASGESRSPRWLVGTLSFTVPRQAMRRDERRVYDCGSFGHVTRIHDRSGIASYGEQIRSLTRRFTDEELRKIAHKALACVAYSDSGAADTHIALYDALAGCWQFVPSLSMLVK
jgi:hypothetical protein